MVSRRQGMVAPACLLLAAGLLGCRGPAMTAGDAGAMPEDPRRALTEMKEARYLAAVAGLDFSTGLVVVTDALPDGGREVAREHLALGREKLDLNQRTGALAEITLAVRADPGWAVAHDALGRALRVKGKGGEALAAYRTAVALDPTFTAARFNAATSFARLGRRAEAIEQMQLVLALEPGHGEAHERLAIWYYYADDDDAAWRHVEAARAAGREPPAQLLALLEAQRPQPGDTPAGP